MKVVDLKEIYRVWDNTLGIDLDEDYKRIKIIGKIETDLNDYFGLSEFKVIDISEAEFVEKDIVEQMCLGWSHSGPVYANRMCTYHYDYLELLLRNIYTQEIILPPYAKRKHMNRIKDSGCIERVIVTDDSKLFSMKDGDVYNKKGTILVFKNKKLKKK
jgi:hypothetical protein